MLYVEPDAGVAPITQMIESAQPGGELLLNFYYLADRDVVEDIARAAGRGVRVYAIVERNPFEISSDKVAAEIQALQQAGARVETTPARFQGHDGGSAFDHAKYAVSKSETIIETANVDRSAFSRNREYIYTSNDPTLAKAMETLFVADFQGNDVDDQVRAMAPNLVLSPGAEDQIVTQINQPGPVCIEVEELGSDQAILSAIQNKGAAASLIVPAGKQSGALSALAAAGVNVKVLPRDPVYLHAKMIVGQLSGYIGSQNFSATSLNDNREVGIILQDPTDLQLMSSTCQTDLANASSLGGN